MTFGPLQGELVRADTAGNTTSLGMIFDSTGGGVPSGINGFETEIVGNDLYFSTPKITGGVTQASQVWRRDLVGGTTTSVYSAATAIIAGLEFDAQGTLWFGEQETGPIRIDLVSRTSAGVVTNHGNLIDTTGVFVSPSYMAFDLDLPCGL